MDWVKTFYSSQNDWFGVYLGDIEENHRQRALLINNMTDASPKNILELGAGGGQTAIALTELGHRVTMIELLEDSTNHAHALAKYYEAPVQIIQGDFYEVKLENKFDGICYFDSFGIGEDKDQRRLLKRIANWLKPDGAAIIEIGSTWYWGGIAKGIQMDIGACMREYDFDYNNSRLIDKWWRPEKPEELVYQSLRCYTPADLNLLLEGTGLRIESIQPGGKVDYEKMEFIPKATLDEAMTYYVKLVKK